MRYWSTYGLSNFRLAYWPTYGLSNFRLTQGRTNSSVCGYYGTVVLCRGSWTGYWGSTWIGSMTLTRDVDWALTYVTREETIPSVCVK